MAVNKTNSKKTAATSRPKKKNARPGAKPDTKSDQPQDIPVLTSTADEYPGDGSELVGRVSRSIERELTRIDLILDGNGAEEGRHAEAERRARTLASLARTLREVTNLRNERGKQKPADDDEIPRDIDQLRRELARRLEGLIAEAKIVCPDETATD
jgi:hypothetical protein